MKKIVLDFTNIHTMRALHIYIAYKLAFPAYYGKNLDALYDCLTDIAEDTAVSIRAEHAAGEVLSYLPRLLRVFEDAAKKNVRLKLV